MANNQSIPAITGNFTINRYRVLPYEHKKTAEENPEDNETLIPFFVGPQMINLRKRTTPYSGSVDINSK
jgi:hypothetical protein